MSRISEQIKSVPDNSLLVGVLRSNDRAGNEVTNSIIEGTPEGFRMLAIIMTEMADQVESGETHENGWGLSLSPEDIPALRTHEVKLLSLSCQPAVKFRDI